VKTRARPRALPFGFERRGVALVIQLQSLLAQQLFGQLNRETVRLVQVENTLARNALVTACARFVHQALDLR
jgi:hypothetical protein